MNKIMMIRVYALPLHVVIFLMLALLVLWAVLSMRIRKNKWPVINAAINLIVVFFVIRSTILTRTPGDYELILMPFAAFAAAKQQPELYREMLMNVFLFFPMGLTLSNALPCRWRISVRIGVTVLVGCVVSVGIEFIQYRFALGTAETDDVICNTLGTFIGSLSLLTALACEKLKEKLGTRK